MGLFSGHAKDIEFDCKEDFFEAIGYLAKPGKLVNFEAQVPEEKVEKFKSEFPHQHQYTINTENETSGGYPMKTGIQLRLYLNNQNNIPKGLKKVMSKGDRINRGLFAEKLLKHYGFNIGKKQDSNVIKRVVASNDLKYLVDFERGYNL